MDLVYFFSASTTPAFRETHLKEYLTFYHDTLIKRLEAFGYSSDVYTFNQLVEDYDSHYSYGYCMGQVHVLVRIIIYNFDFRVK